MISLMKGMVNMRSTEPQINESVFSLQTFLRDISQRDERIPSVIPDGRFDVQTENAVKEFQRFNGLLVDGIVDNDTWDTLIKVHEDLTEPVYLPQIICLDELTNKKITLNEFADCLFVIQAMLHILSLRFPNLPDLEISGQHKEDSVNSTREIQKISGLSPTGEMDLKTYNAIAKLYEIYL